MGQLGHESHRVGDQDGLTTREGQLTGPRVKGLEEAIGSRNSRIGEFVEQRRLSGIGVAHKRHLSTTTPLTLCPLEGARLVDPSEVCFEPVHSSNKTSSIHLELGLAWASRADATRLLR